MGRPVDDAAAAGQGVARLRSAARATGPWTSAKVLQALRTHYLYECWNTVSFPELELRSHQLDDKCFRRADYMTVFCHGITDSYRFAKDRKPLYNPRYEPYPLQRIPGGWRTGFEIKVSRADLLCDLKQQWKQNPLALVCNEVYLVHPRGLWKKKPHPNGSNTEVDEFDLPWSMGRIEVYHDERPRWYGALRAKIVELPSYNMQPETPPWLLANMLLHNRPHYTEAGNGQEQQANAKTD